MINEPPPSLIGNSPAIRNLRDQILAAARTPSKVLILGETGVGKDMVSRLIHDQGARAARSFVAVNCSGVPETLLESELFGFVRGSFTGAFRDRVGLVQQADKGTLFLDEVGEMSLRMQAMLLRFTETGEVQRVGGDGPRRFDVRLIAATNRDLRARVGDGTFREDLYYRLSVIQIHVPPLRDRADDILLLLEYYLDRIASAFELRKPELTREAAELLLTYGWPGNVRELRNVAERLVVSDFGRPITCDDLPSVILNDVVGSRDAPGTRTADSAQSLIAPGLTFQVAEHVERLWGRLKAGEDFWTVVHEPFMARQITRTELLALVDRALRLTEGSFRRMLSVFNLEKHDYKRLHAFLRKQRCNPSVTLYRRERPTNDRHPRPSAAKVTRGASRSRKNTS